MPKVSICSQVLNNSDKLKIMVKSVIDQTFKDWELVIVDDGSTEDIKSVIDAFNDSRIRLIRLDQNVGVPAGINIAMKNATGEYLGLLAADEFISPDKLEKQLDFMQKHPGVDCVWGLPGSGEMGLRPEWEQYFLRAHNRSNEAWMKTLLELDNVPIGGASLLIKHDVMKKLDYMDEKVTIFSDHQMYCKFFSMGFVGVVLPFRWADEIGGRQPDHLLKDSVRFKNQHKSKEEYEYVKSKYQIIPPPVKGKVTIGIPCFNHAKYLPDAVNSALNQTYEDLEILILNDGGTDNFTDVVHRFNDSRIKVMAFPENMGVWEAQNQMAFRAEGLFYVPLAADDTIDPTFVERCLAEFEKDPWLEMVATQTDFMKEDKTPYNDPSNPLVSIAKAQNLPREEMLAALYPGNRYFGAGMYRTKVLSDLGGWEKEYKVIADYQMYLKILQRYRIHVIEEPLTHTRVDGKNNSLLSPERAAELPSLYHNARKPFFRQRMKVVIATPFYELKGFSPYISSLTETCRLMTAHGIDWRFMELSGDSYVHRARNTMCDTFLMDPEATDLFFIDSDMSWNPEAVIKMLILPHPVLGGSYPVKNSWENWTSIPKMLEEDGKNHYIGQVLPDGSALIEANVLAGGFLRIKRAALEAYREHYKDLWYLEPSSSPTDPGKKFTAFFAAESSEHKFYGEDHMFSKRMREMGIKMFIFPDVDITHWGYKNFSGNFHKFLKPKDSPQKAA